jgi:hypothetical protein
LAPFFTASRPISASPRVIRAAMALAPKPQPSEMPAAMATTFLTQPPTSQPTTSPEV